MSVEDTDIYSLNFAVDRVLIAQDPCDIEYLIRKLKDKCEKWTFMENVGKNIMDW
jgi:hypothetical protein